MSSEECEPGPDVRTIASQLASRSRTASEQARADLTGLDDDALVQLARELLARYRQTLTRDQYVRGAIATASTGCMALPLVCIGRSPYLFIFSFVVAAVLMGIGGTVWRRIPALGRRWLRALAAVMSAVHGRYGLRLTLNDLCPDLDQTAVAYMYHYCPALVDVLPPFQALPVPAGEVSRQQRLLYLHKTVRTPFDLPEATIAALRELEALGDESSIPLVRAVAKIDSSTLWMRVPMGEVETAQGVHLAALHCLAALKGRGEFSLRLLLRAAEKPGTDTLLLRASHTAHEESAVELLRASDRSE